MSFKRLSPVLAVGGFLALLVSISARAQAPKSCDDETSFGRSDKTLFGKYCGACHTMSGRWKRLVKTPLAGIFDREQLGTGEAPSEEAVRGIIENGRPYMPGFKYTLTPSQINELVQFLKSAKCKPIASNIAMLSTHHEPFAADKRSSMDFTPAVGGE